MVSGTWCPPGRIIMASEGTPDGPRRRHQCSWQVGRIPSALEFIIKEYSGVVPANPRDCLITFLKTMIGSVSEPFVLTLISPFATDTSMYRWKWITDIFRASRTRSRRSEHFCLCVNLELNLVVLVPPSATFETLLHSITNQEYLTGNYNILIRTG